MTATVDKAQEILKEYWGFDEFKKGQHAVINAVLQGKSVLAVLPTGYGKTVCFQIPAMLAKGGTIVFSPLISLMKDQTDDCKKKGIEASFVNSHISETEAETRLDKFTKGEYKILYVAPERVKNASFQKALSKSSISYIVVDEAHCASRWGHDFRPAYMNIKQVFNYIRCANGRKPPVIAVTATATRDIEDDIAESLGMPEYERVVADPTRHNIEYSVTKGNPWNALDDICRKMSRLGGRHIIYTSSRNGAEKILEDFVSKYVSPKEYGFYHAGMKKEKRDKIQNDFKEGRKTIICATCAFGMGIDIPDIRTVVHFGIPGSLEDYCQETGRAGRDGLQSQALLIHSSYGVKIQEFLLDCTNPPYLYYRFIWDYLHDVLEEGDTLFKSADEISKEINIKKGVEIGNAVNTVLSIMEKKGMVKRDSGGAKMTIHVELDLIKEALEQDDLRGNQKATAEAILENADKINTVNDLVIDQKVLSHNSGLNVKSLKNAITALSKKNFLFVEPQFRGKSTKILKYGAMLERLISEKEVEDKRKKDRCRLDTMIAYTKTLDRREFIRDYFMNPKGK